MPSTRDEHQVARFADVEPIDEHIASSVRRVPVGRPIPRTRSKVLEADERVGRLAHAIDVDGSLTHQTNALANAVRRRAI